MKKFFSLILILGLAVGAGYLWFEQSIYRALMNLKAGIQAADLEQVEEHADMDALSENVMDYGEVASEELAGKAAGDLGKLIAGGLAGLIRGNLDPKVKDSIKNELRASIAEGKAFEMLGPFKPAEGVDGLAGIETDVDGSTKLVSVRGTCEKEEVILVARFKRYPRGPFDLFGTYKATGATRESLKALARACSRR